MRLAKRRDRVLRHWRADDIQPPQSRKGSVGLPGDERPVGVDRLQLLEIGQRSEVAYPGATELYLAEMQERPHELNVGHFIVGAEIQALKRRKGRQCLRVLQLAAEEAQHLQPRKACNQPKVEPSLRKCIDELQVSKRCEVLPAHEPHRLE